jgi:hypothetical protein
MLAINELFIANKQLVMNELFVTDKQLETLAPLLTIPWITNH